MQAGGEPLHWTWTCLLRALLLPLLPLVLLPPELLLPCFAQSCQLQIAVLSAAVTTQRLGMQQMQTMCSALRQCWYRHSHHNESDSPAWVYPVQVSHSWPSFLQLEHASPASSVVAQSRQNPDT